MQCSLFEKYIRFVNCDSLTFKRVTTYKTFNDERLKAHLIVKSRLHNDSA